MKVLRAREKARLWVEIKDTISGKELAIEYPVYRSSVSRTLRMSRPQAQQLALDIMAVLE